MEGKCSCPSQSPFRKPPLVESPLQKMTNELASSWTIASACHYPAGIAPGALFQRGIHHHSNLRIRGGELHPIGAPCKRACLRVRGGSPDWIPPAYLALPFGTRLLFTISCLVYVIGITSPSLEVIGARVRQPLPRFIGSRKSPHWFSEVA